ncbi:MAG TPA: DUF2651 family protein [Pseudogracilibacillus sp.]|nr:DUF2651 family protein [Pseudogracilibacillus sp.]
MNSSNLIDMVEIIWIVLPVIVLVISFIIQLIFKKEFLIIIGNFMIWFIVILVVFDISFIVYPFIYTLVAIIGIVLANLTLKIMKKP